MPTSEPRWPAPAAFLTTWLRPATSARQMQHVPLTSAFVIHLTAVVLAFLLIMWLLAIDEGKTVAYELAEALRELPRNQLGQIAVVGLFALGIECGFLLLAFLMMPWGAGDERLRSSWKHALRITWLHTTHALPLVLGVGSVVAFCDRCDRRFCDIDPYPAITVPEATRKPPKLPKNPTPEQIGEYRQQVEQRKQAQAEAVAKRQAAYLAWEQRKPWMVKYEPAIIMWFVALGTGWLLWALLRAVGAERSLPPIAHPPTCEFCGYNLTGAAFDGRCPECGHRVADSLGPNTRPGPDWHRRHEIGRWRAWWRCAVTAVRRPSEIGRQIPVCSRTTDHRVFLATSLPAGFIVGATVPLAALWGILRIIPKKTPFTELFDEIAMLTVPWGGTIGVLAILAVTLLAAVVVGLIRSVQERRNLLPAATQVSAYLSGFLVVCLGFAGLTISGLVLANVLPDSFIGPWARQTRINRDILVFLCCTILNLPWLAVYLSGLWRGIGAARYANH